MKQEEIILSVNSELVGERLDRFLSSKLDNYTRSFIQKMISSSDVFVNGVNKNKNYKVALNDEIKVILREPEKLEVLPERIPLDIVYEDSDIIVVNKPKGMVVHPAAGHSSGTLVNALLYYCKDTLSGINGVLRPGIVHRIDKDTSGLLMVAKSDKAHQGLAEQIKEHSFKREYEAIVYGNLKDKCGRVDAPIGRHVQKRKQMAVFVPNAKRAITDYSVLKSYDGFDHLRLKLYTGRTHQIRVHMAYLGHPIAGDEIYGFRKVIKSLRGQCLHAKFLGFVHPISGKYMEFESNLPDYFVKFEESLK